MSPARLTGAAIAVAGSLLLAACTSSSSTTSSSTTPSTPVSTPTTVAATTPSVTVAPSTSTSPTTSPSPSATTSPPAAAPQFTTTCTSLSVRVIKGGAIRGTEIASMQFVNGGTSACSITGSPTAVLLRNGAVIGTPSQPGGGTARSFTMQPGDVGESLLRDFSSCNAPLSDSLRLTLPSRNGTAGRTVTEPVVLRACALQAAPVGAPA